MLQILGKTDKLRDEWTVRKIVNNYKSGVSVFDNAVQRGLVWKNDKKSRLIRSTILNRPIPPIYASKRDEIYNNLDGKQRSHTYVEFLNDEFSLEGLDPISVKNTETGEIEDVELNGKCFSELPEELQNAITDATLTVIVINNVTEDEECEIFYDINNGQPLNAITIARATAKSRKDITQLGSHELFQNALTKKALEKYTNEDIVVKSWAILNQENPSLESKDIKKLMSEVELTGDDMIQLEKCFDRVLATYKVIDDRKIAKRILTRTHMISIMRMVWKSIEDGKSVEDFADWFVKFYCGKRSSTNDDVYNSLCRTGTNKSSAVCKRLEILENNYNEFFTMKSENIESKDD